MGLPLTEFDPDRTAVVVPSPPVLREPLPPRAVLCFFPEVLDDLAATHAARTTGRSSAEIGGGDVQVVVHEGEPVAVADLAVGELVVPDAAVRDEGTSFHHLPPSARVVEAAAFLAVTAFRGVRSAQYLYAGDDLSGPQWDARGWTTHPVRRALLDLSLAAVVRL